MPLEGSEKHMFGKMKVAGLTLMIRATRSRSSRPNHMPSHLDALQTKPPVNFCDLLAVYAAAPEDGDAAALRGLVAGLQESLGEVRAALAKVEHC